MINCLNEPYDAARKFYMEERRKKLRKYSWYRAYEKSPIHQYKLHKEQLEEEKRAKARREDLDKVKEMLIEWELEESAENKDLLIKLLSKRVQYLTFSEDFPEEEFMDEIVPLMNLLEYYDPLPEGEFPTAEESYERFKQMIKEKYPQEYGEFYNEGEDIVE